MILTDEIACTAYQIKFLLCFLSVKRRRSRILSLDKKQQQEHIQTEEWTCVKSVKTTNTTAKEEERIEVDDDSS